MDSLSVSKFYKFLVNKDGRSADDTLLLDQPNAKFIFQVQDNNCKRFCYFDSAANALSYIKAHPEYCFYEMIKGNSIQRLKFDYDMPLDGQITTDNACKLLNDLATFIWQCFEEMFGLLRNPKREVSLSSPSEKVIQLDCKPSLIVKTNYSSDGQMALSKKLSAHFVIVEAVASVAESRAFYEYVKKKMSASALASYAQYLDPKVYNSTQAFRTIYSSKPGADAFMKIHCVYSLSQENKNRLESMTGSLRNPKRESLYDHVNLLSFINADRIDAELTKREEFGLPSVVRTEYLHSDYKLKRTTKHHEKQISNVDKYLPLLAT